MRLILKSKARTSKRSKNERKRATIAIVIDVENYTIDFCRRELRKASNFEFSFTTSVFLARFLSFLFCFEAFALLFKMSLI